MNDTIFEDFINLTFETRKQLLDESRELVNIDKKNRYNSQKMLNECEICSSKKNLETHHINFQKNTLSDGKVIGKPFHKNEVFNLCTLCHDCHNKVTQEKTIVRGYIDTINGKILDYYFV